MDEQVTHQQLIKRGMQWLANTRHCGVVLSEIVSSCTNERPDVIGWKYGSNSILLECKVSRSDFFAQKNKPHVRTGTGMGRERYYLTPARLITEEDLGDSDYGLLWFRDGHLGSVKVVKEATKRTDYDKDSEMAVLVSTLRRMKLRDFLVIVPPDQIEEVMEVA